jgi:hypothetical protein
LTGGKQSVVWWHNPSKATMNDETTSTGLLDQLGQAYRTTFLTFDSTWITPAVFIGALVVAIATAFFHEYVLEPKFVKRYYTRHKAFPDQKTMMWYRAGNFVLMLVLVIIYMLLINWPQ